MNESNLYPDLGVGMRATARPVSPSLNFNTPRNLRPRLPHHVAEEISQSATSNISSMNTTHENLSSPLQQKFSLPTFIQSPARFIEQLPASPASLLLSPLVKKNDNDSSSSSFFLNNEDETNLIEQVDDYFMRRRQYLQQNIDISLNISKWVLENLIFYSVETLRYEFYMKDCVRLNSPRFYNY